MAKTTPKISIGTDIVEIQRIEDAISDQGMFFLRRLYTDAEIERYSQSIPSLAARFAAKEAVIKAIGNRIGNLAYRDIEVLSDSEGKPYVSLPGAASDKFREKDIGEIAISLSHCDKYALAYVACARRS